MWFLENWENSKFGKIDPKIFTISKKIIEAEKLESTEIRFLEISIFSRFNALKVSVQIFGWNQFFH